MHDKQTATFFSRFIYLVVTLTIGFGGLTFLFADITPLETVPSRLISIVLFYLFFGGIISYWTSPRWWLSGGIAWTAIGIFISALPSALHTSIEEVISALFLLLPLTAALLGGWIVFKLREG